MRTVVLILMLGVLVLFLTGCSEKQKEADKLEQEMEQMDSGIDAVVEEVVTEDVPGSPTPDAAAIPAEETPSAPSVTLSSPEGDGYTVQVASCEDAAYASHLSDLYKERGYDVFVSRFEHEGQTFYRVRLGNFTTLAEAKDLKAEMADKYSQEGWIAPN